MTHPFGFMGVYDTTVPPGTIWTARSGTGPTGGGKYEFVAYGAGTFVATGYMQTAISSPDGITWSTISGISGAVAVVFNPDDNVFLAVSDTQAWTSVDGINWSDPADVTLPLVTGLAWGNGTYMAVSVYDPSPRVSTNGIEWTNPPDVGTNYLMSVAYGDGVFIATNFISNAVYRSNDNGMSWNGMPTYKPQTKACWGNGVFVVGNDTASVNTSTDGGYTWNYVPAEGIPASGGIVYGDGIFVITSSSPGNATATSSSGADGTWSAHALPFSKSWGCVGYGNHTFVLLGSGGTFVTSP